MTKKQKPGSEVPFLDGDLVLSIPKVRRLLKPSKALGKLLKASRGEQKAQMQR
jgi:hypothetical protein